MTLKILGIAGSLRKDSFNKALLRTAGQLLPAGAELSVFDLNGIPVFNQDDEGSVPSRVIEFKQAIEAADAILFATPEYNYSIPGPLKNAIDWASRPYGKNSWNGKPVAVMGAGAGNFGTIRAQYQLRQIAALLNMHPLNQPEVMVGTAYEKIDAQGTLTDTHARDAIAAQVKALVEWTQRLQRGKA